MALLVGLDGAGWTFTDGNVGSGSGAAGVWRNTAFTPVADGTVTTAYVYIANWQSATNVKVVAYRASDRALLAESADISSAGGTGLRSAAMSLSVSTSEDIFLVLVHNNYVFIRSNDNGSSGFAQNWDGMTYATPDDPLPTGSNVAGREFIIWLDGDSGSASVGEGTLEAGDSAVAGTGTREVTGTGAAVAGESSADGTGTTFASITGTGTIEAQAAAIAGSGVILSVRNLVLTAAQGRELRDHENSPVELNGIIYEWYDDPDDTDGNPTDEGTFNTDASGEATVVLTNSALSDGSFGGLVLRHPSDNAIRGYYRIPVTLTQAQ